MANPKAKLDALLEKQKKVIQAQQEQADALKKAQAEAPTNETVQPVRLPAQPLNK